MLKLNGHQGNTYPLEWLKFKSQSTLFGSNVEMELPYAALGLYTFTTTWDNYLALSTNAEHMNTQDSTIPLTVLPTQCNMCAPNGMYFCSRNVGRSLKLETTNLSQQQKQHILVNSNNEMHRLGAACYMQPRMNLSNIILSDRARQRPCN